jgi:hypothetical protein
LVEKIEETNYKAREISLTTLVDILRNPVVDIKILFDRILDMKGKINSPRKTPWRAVLGRLEIVHQILQDLGYDRKKWDWKPIMQDFVVPAVQHSHPDVRLLAMEIVLTFYTLIGNPVRQIV